MGYSPTDGRASLGSSQRDAKPLGLALGSREPLDLVGWIAVARGLGGPVEHPLQLVEAEQEGRRENRQTCHSVLPS